MIINFTQKVTHLLIKILIFIVSLYGFLIFIWSSIAQENSPSGVGMEAEQIKVLLGEPDKQSIDAKNNQIWSYGDSMVFFKDSKVIAWSDNGELKKLSETSKLAKDKNSKQTQELKGWINAWTPPRINHKDEIVDGILPLK